MDYEQKDKLREAQSGLCSAALSTYVKVRTAGYSLHDALNYQLQLLASSIAENSYHSSAKLWYRGVAEGMYKFSIANPHRGFYALEFTPHPFLTSDEGQVWVESARLMLCHLLSWEEEQDG